MRMIALDTCREVQTWTRLSKAVVASCEAASAMGWPRSRACPTPRRPSGRTDCDLPRAVEPWDGVRDALTFGPKSPQVAYPPGIAEALAELVGAGEDCLTLNIWTPDLGAARAAGDGLDPRRHVRVPRHRRDSFL